MAEVRFLFDEQIPHLLVRELCRGEPRIDALIVATPGAPVAGTKDPELLLFAEATQRLFVSQDRRTMPRHLANHFAAGRHLSGVILLRSGHPLVRYVNELLIVWGASTADEWIDRVCYLPE